MLSGRDRALAWFLGVQLVVAVAFGAVLVHALRKPATTTVVTSGAAAPGTQASTSAGGKGKGTTTTSVVGGSGGTGGTAGTSGTAGSGGLADKGTGAGATGVAAGAPITFGSIVTQNFSISFAASKQGTQAYLAQVNAKGGAGGHKINMIYDDDQGNGSTGSNEVNALIAQKVLAFAAFNAPITEGQGNGQLVAQLAQNQIPLIGSYGESSEYMSPYAFAFTADYVHFGYEMGLFLAKKGVKQAGFMYVDNSPDTTANHEIERGFTDGLRAGGVTTKPLFDAVAPTNPSYSGDVNTFKSGKVDGMATILDNTAYGRLLSAQSSANYWPTHVADPLFDLAKVKSQAHTDQHPVYVASDLDFLETGGPQVKAYADAVTALGETPSYLGEAGWVDAEYLTAAVAKLGASFTRTQLLAAVNSLGSYDNGFTSPLHIAPGNHDMNRCIKFGFIQNQVLTQVQGWTCDSETP